MNGDASKPERELRHLALPAGDRAPAAKPQPPYSRRMPYPASHAWGYADPAEPAARLSAGERRIEPDCKSSSSFADARSNDEAHHRPANEVEPMTTASRFGLAIAFAGNKRFAEAIKVYEEILSVSPNDPGAYNNLGTVLKETGRLDDGEWCYRRALQLRPDFPEALNNLGVLLAARGHTAEAENSFRKALSLKDKFPEASNNLSDLLRIGGRLDEAEAHARTAVASRPNYASGQVNLGNALRDSGQFDEARDWYERALSVEPEHPEALNNLASLLFDLGRVDEAIGHYRSALALRPDYADAHTNLALALLLGGRFDEGWREYEWRWRQEKNKPHLRNFSQPLWSGEDLGDKVLLVHAEQGFGDTLQFCRFVADVVPGRRVILEVQAPLKSLLADLPGVEQIVARGEPLPPFDLHCPLLSLPRVLGTSLSSIPADVPYVRADQQRVAAWQKRLAPHPGLRVGLVWAGNQAMGADRRRSIGLDQFSPLADVPGVCFVSLQKGPAAAQAHPAGMVLHDWTDELHDFADTAALVEALDLVISVDTAVVHLAGALGKPVWLLNRFDRCWRWLVDRDDSPWYPSLKQFRQTEPGDWDGVFITVRESLLALTERKAKSDKSTKLFDEAVRLHRAGRLREAEAIYEEILADSPAHADSLHLLGVVAFQTGESAKAVVQIRQALELLPQNGIYLNNLGNALKALGRHDEAEESYGAAIASTRDYVDPQINLGNLLYAAERTAEARAVYEVAVQTSPAHLDARLGLGNALLKLGHPQSAEAHYREALRLAPSSIPAHLNLGSALRDLGRLAEAEDFYRAALKLNAGNPVILVNLGQLLVDAGQMDEAELHFRAAVRTNPDFAEAHNGLGNLLTTVGSFDAAEASCLEALRLKPGYAAAHINLGNIHKARRDFLQAEASYREAIRLNFHDPVGHNNLASLLTDRDRLEEAEDHCRQALKLKPDFADALSNLGAIVKHQGNFDEAYTLLSRAVALRPRSAEGHNNLGAACGDLGRVDEAIGHYRSAVALRPDYADAHTNLALALLLGGHFDEGWQEYEWRRWQEKNKPHLRNFSQPLWNGEDLGDKVLLVHAEQGFGDTLQFCRFVSGPVPGRRVILEVQAPLKSLLADLPGVEQIVARGEPLPPFDLHCPLLSLPRILGTSLATIPAEVPYVRADQQRVAGWQKRLAPHPGLRVGLVWAGNQAMGADRRRSLTLDQFSPLADVPGVCFVSLQKGPAAAQALPAGMVLHDWTDELHDFADTAALVEALDLVISVDTAVVHLAGALGKPVWLLNRFDRCWRWLIDRNDSPWYPSLKQFRQTEPGDWDGVVRSLGAALVDLTASSPIDRLVPTSPGKPIRSATDILNATRPIRVAGAEQ